MGLFGRTRKDDRDDRTDDRTDDRDDVPLAKVIGSKGKGGWFGRKPGRDGENIVKKLGGYGTSSS
jgi:hypothetical protein